MSHSPRFAEFRQLLFGGDGLTPEEARYLKLLLSDIHTDLIGELPLEIVTLVALELQLDDFVCCLRVSKLWRQRFLSDSVTSAYARHRWPAMIDGVVNRSRFLETLLELTCVLYNYRKSVATEHVLFDSRAHYTLDPVFHNQSDNLPNVYMRYFTDARSQSGCSAFYTSGKVASHLCGCVIVIDDLRSKTRKIFTPPSGAMHGSALKLQSLGSRLVIGTIDRLLIAWDHVNNQAYEKSLPCRMLRCATQNNRVAIVLYGGEVVIWTLSHAVIQVDTSRLILGLGINPSEAKTWEACLNVFFDPRNSKKLYLASGYLFRVGSKSMIRVTVHEFLEAVHVASWSSDYQDPTVYRDGVQSSPDEHTPEPRIVTSEYEADHSCILFSRRFFMKADVRLTAFDKIKRKFVDIVDCQQNYLCYEAVEDRYQRPRDEVRHGSTAERTDLDFKVVFTRQGYEVTRLKMPSTYTQ
ncbi:hypothetical protein F5B21DRAFT_464596 [Xylaria acuta]|nr:hypothetical protein F5B21DRAFT_464596 [Xylaria acuta]